MDLNLNRLYIVGASWYGYCEILGQVMLRYMEFLILVKDEGNIDGSAMELM